MKMNRKIASGIQFIRKHSSIFTFHKSHTNLLKITTNLVSLTSNESVAALCSNKNNNFPIVWKSNCKVDENIESIERAKVAHLTIKNGSVSQFRRMNIDENQIKLVLSNLGTEDLKCLANDYSISGSMYLKILVDLRKLCINVRLLPEDFFEVIINVKEKNDDVHSLFPYFLRHAKKLYPFLALTQEVKEAFNLVSMEKKFLKAREIRRKIIFHAGPTNGGKTCLALQKLFDSSSGVYTGPSNLLCYDVYDRLIARKISSELTLTEDKCENVFPCEQNNEINHFVSSIQMLNLDQFYGVAVIDEIHKISDSKLGWAWTRALLGLQCKEIHICGDFSAINIVEKLILNCDDDLEVKMYDRIGPLHVEEMLIDSWDKLVAGDCVVCFNDKNMEIYAEEISNHGYEVVVLDESLPSITNIETIHRFNDLKNSCIMITNGMIEVGLNINIRRIIFDSLEFKINSEEQQPSKTLDPFLIKQVSGRAGGFHITNGPGLVGARNKEDLDKLILLLETSHDNIRKAGVKPEFDAYKFLSSTLPNIKFKELTKTLDITCTIDESLYFFCINRQHKYLSAKLDCFPLNIQQHYTLSQCPFKFDKFSFLIYERFVHLISEDIRVDTLWLENRLKWNADASLNHLKSIHKILIIYMWLSHHYPHLFDVDDVIQRLKCNTQNMISELMKNYRNLNVINVFTYEDNDDHKDYSLNDGLNASTKLQKSGIISPLMLDKMREEYLNGAKSSDCVKHSSSNFEKEFEKSTNEFHQQQNNLAILKKLKQCLIGLNLNSYHNENPVSLLHIICSKSLVEVPDFIHIDTGKDIEKNMLFTYFATMAGIDVEASAISKKEARKAIAAIIIDKIESFTVDIENENFQENSKSCNNNSRSKNDIYDVVAMKSTCHSILHSIKSENAIAVLHNLSNKMKTNPPTFTFTSFYEKKTTRYSCNVDFLNISETGVGSSKQRAKLDGATKVVNHLVGNDDELKYGTI